MTDKNTTATVTDDRLEDELEALIGDATAANDSPPETAESDAESTAESTADGDIDLEEIEAAAAVAAAKSAAYATQPAEESDGAEATSDSASSTATTKTRAPRVSRAAGAKPFDVLKAAINDDEALAKVAMLVTGDTPSTSLVDDLANTINALAKKVGDKATNLLRYKGQPSKIQKYTTLGLNLLIEKGSVSSKELVSHLESSGYTIGTARSQANQLMSLFPALKIANRSGRQLSLRSDSTIVEAYKTALTAA